MSREAMKLALEALKEISSYYMSLPKKGCMALAAIEEALAQPEGCQCPACKIAPHASDCPVHNEPAWPNGPCDCGAQPEPEPVAWAISYDGETPYALWDGGDCALLDIEVKRHGGKTRKMPLYASPPKREPEPVIDKSAAIRIATSLGWTPKREWVGLPDEEMHECWDSPLTPLGMKCARAIEAKLKEKNT